MKNLDSRVRAPYYDHLVILSFASGDTPNEHGRERLRAANLYQIDINETFPAELPLPFGCDASFVLLQASDPVEAIRLKATRLAVVRRGKVIARNPERVTTLSIDGRPTRIDRRL